MENQREEGAPRARLKLCELEMYTVQPQLRGPCARLLPKLTDTQACGAGEIVSVPRAHWKC